MRASQVVYFVGLAVMIVIITTRYFSNGSFWLDEAAVAQNFQQLPISEAFGPFLGENPQSFPRFYFLLIRSMQEIFGYQTAVLRFFPFVFSLAATTIFMNSPRTSSAIIARDSPVQELY